MRVLQILILGLALSGLTACGDYAYGPGAPQDEQIKHWGGVGKNQPVSVGFSREVILESKIDEIYIKPGYRKAQVVDDYMDCTAQANHPNANQALSTSYKRAICMFNRGYDFAESMTGLDASYNGFCGHELFRAKNLAFCRSTSDYQAKLNKLLEMQDAPGTFMQLWSSQHHSYRQKLIDNLDCSEIGHGTAKNWNYYPFHQTWGECMTKRGYELIDDIESYKNYAGFCGWKPYFLKHTEFCLTNKDNIYYETNMKLFKDYYQLHGLPNPNEPTTRPGDKD